MGEINIGPSVTQYTLKPAEGVKLSRIIGLQSDLSLALAAHPLRIEAPIPGRSLVGIEMPNSAKTTLGLASLFKEEGYAKSDLPLIVSFGAGCRRKSAFRQCRQNAPLAGRRSDGQRQVHLHPFAHYQPSLPQPAGVAPIYNDRPEKSGAHRLQRHPPYARSDYNRNQESHHHFEMAGQRNGKKIRGPAFRWRERHSFLS